MLRILKLHWRALSIIPIILIPTSTSAHVSEQGLILLLPTNLYIASGTLAVIATILVISLLPNTYTSNLFRRKLHIRFISFPFASEISLLSTLFLFSLLYLGFYGPHDPTKNLLSLIIWTIWWQGILVLQALFGNLWHWINPWTGFYKLLRGNRESGLFVLPTRLGSLPGIISFFLFSAFELTDIAPDDPDRLAIFVLSYWLYTMAGMILFGAKVWLSRAECFSMLLRFFSLLSIFAIRRGILFIGFPGWRLVRAPTPTFSSGIFAIIILATGSFDGLNETFWWLHQIGINPLLFPGRSTVIWENLCGLVVADILLPLCFAVCILVGVKLSNNIVSVRNSFVIFSTSVLPIAVGYHFSHYLTAFLVGSQYTIAALTDPMKNGADYLNLGTYYVTSGFLNTHNTVQFIWLTQAAAVVTGHIVAVLISHYLAIKYFPILRNSMLLQIPLSLFMIAYTIFGLWLLASPRGL